MRPLALKPLTKVNKVLAKNETNYHDDEAEMSLYIEGISKLEVEI